MTANDDCIIKWNPRRTRWELCVRGTSIVMDSSSRRSILEHEYPNAEVEQKVYVKS